MGSTSRANPPCLALPSGDTRSCPVHMFFMGSQYMSQVASLLVTCAKQIRSCTLWSGWHSCHALHQLLCCAAMSQ